MSRQDRIPHPPQCTFSPSSSPSPSPCSSSRSPRSRVGCPSRRRSCRWSRDSSSALIPGVTIPELDPNLVFFVFLPPILWSAAMFTSLREFKRNFGPIGTLAVGLVHRHDRGRRDRRAACSFPVFPGRSPSRSARSSRRPTPSPPRRSSRACRVPRRVITVLEGESLVNDASALVLYRTAVAAAVTGTFSWGESIVRFFIDAGIGSLVGLLVGVADHPRAAGSRGIRSPRRCSRSPGRTSRGRRQKRCTSRRCSRASRAGCTCSKSSRPRSARRRDCRSRTVWELVVFLLNALIFLLLGAQFGVLIRSVPRERACVRVCATVRSSPVVAIARAPRLGAARDGAPSAQREACEVERAKPNWKGDLARVVDEHARRRVARDRARAADRHRQRRALSASHGDHSHHDVRDRADAGRAGALARDRSCARSASRRRKRIRQRSDSRVARRRGAAPRRSRISSHEPWVDPRDVEALRAELRERAAHERAARVDDSRGAAGCASR